MHQSEKRTEAPLLSRSSILIIGAFLVGMSTGQTEHQFLLAATGTGSLILYFGFESFLRLRNRFLELRRQMLTERTLANRLTRHVPQNGDTRPDFAHDVHIRLNSQYATAGQADYSTTTNSH